MKKKNSQVIMREIKEHLFKNELLKLIIDFVQEQEEEEMKVAFN